MAHGSGLMAPGQGGGGLAPGAHGIDWFMAIGSWLLDRAHWIVPTGSCPFEFPLHFERDIEKTQFSGSCFWQGTSLAYAHASTPAELRMPCIVIAGEPEPHDDW